MNYQEFKNLTEEGKTWYNWESKRYIEITLFNTSLIVGTTILWGMGEMEGALIISAFYALTNILVLFKESKIKKKHSKKVSK